MELGSPYFSLVETLENFGAILYTTFSTVVLVFPPVLTLIISCSPFQPLKNLYLLILGFAFILIDYILMIILLNKYPIVALELKSFDIAFLVSALILGWLVKVVPIWVFRISVFLAEYIYFSEFTYPNYVRFCQLKCLEIPIIDFFLI